MENRIRSIRHEQPQEMEDLAEKLRPLLASHIDPSDLHAHQWLLVGEKL